MGAYVSPSKEQIQETAKEFGIHAQGFSLLDGGSANSNFLVDSKEGRFVLSISNEKSADEMSNLVNLLLALEMEQFPTARLVPNSDGRYITDYVGNPAIMETYIEGEIPKVITQKMAKQIGAAIGKLHQMDYQGNLPTTFAYGIECFNDVTESRPINDYVSWLKNQTEHIYANMSQGLPVSSIHGDIFDDNTIFQGEELAAIIDFEEACHYFRVFDLGMCIIGTCVNDGSLDLGGIKSLIEGYQSVETLEPSELYQLKLFAEYASTATSFWRYRQYNIRSPATSKLDEHQEMVSIAESVKAIPNDAFLESIL